MESTISNNIQKQVRQGERGDVVVRHFVLIITLPFPIYLSPDGTE